MEHRVIFHSLELFIIEENGGGQPGSGDGEISRDTTRGNIDGITLSGDWLCSLFSPSSASVHPSMTKVSLKGFSWAA